MEDLAEEGAAGLGGRVLAGADRLSPFVADLNELSLPAAVGAGGDGSAGEVVDVGPFPAGFFVAKDFDVGGGVGVLFVYLRFFWVCSGGLFPLMSTFIHGVACTCKSFSRGARHIILRMWALP